MIIRQPKAGDNQFDSEVLLEGPEDGVATAGTNKHRLPAEGAHESSSRRLDGASVNANTDWRGHPEVADPDLYPAGDPLNNAGFVRLPHPDPGPVRCHTDLELHFR